MRNHSEHFPFPATQGISPSSLTLLSDKAGKYACPLKYRFQKVDEIEIPPSDAMLCGTLFDMFCNGNSSLEEACEFMEYTSLSQEVMDLVNERFLSYASHINYETDWLQVPVWKEIREECVMLNARYLFGYVDRIETEECPDCNGEGHVFGVADAAWISIPEHSDEVQQGQGIVNTISDCPRCRGRGRIPTKIIDHKLSKERWKERKTSYNIQAQTYIACIEAMYGVRVPFEFHVVNLKTDEIQIFPYKPQAKSLKALDKIALDAIQLRESGDFIPEPDPFKCKYCDYQIQCASHMKGAGNNINEHIKV